MPEIANVEDQAQPKGTPDFSNWTCPLPLVGYSTIVMGHGGGGKLGNERLSTCFSPHSATRLLKTWATPRPSISLPAA